MAGSWSIEEIKALITIWGQKNVQHINWMESIEIVTFTNLSLWSWRTKGMQRHGNSAEQRLKTLCRNIRRSVIFQLHDTHSSLAKCFLKIKDHNNVSGNNRENWEYFKKINAILGTRPTSASAFVHRGAGDMSQIPSSALNYK